MTEFNKKMQEALAKDAEKLRAMGQPVEDVQFFDTDEGFEEFMSAYLKGEKL